MKKIVHIYAGDPFKKANGINTVLNKLPNYQNKYVDSFVYFIKRQEDYEELREFINNNDSFLTIFHGVYHPQYIRISRFLSRKSIKYYIEPHSSFMKKAQKKGRMKKSLANKTIFKSFLENAYGYIFLNESEKKNSIFRTERDVIIPNGIDIQNFEIKKDISGKVRLFFLGRLDVHHKGLDILFESLKKIDNEKRNFSVDFFGVGSEEEIRIITSYINEFENIDLNFKGSVYDRDKEKVLKDYNIMVLTSRYEGFPMTILEALSYGNPCIVTDGTNVREMIENNKLGWGADYDSISETILKAVEDYRMNKDFYIENTKSFVDENYSWQHIAKRSVDVLLK